MRSNLTPTRNQKSVVRISRTAAMEPRIDKSANDLGNNSGWVVASRLPRRITRDGLNQWSPTVATEHRLDIEYLIFRYFLLTPQISGYILPKSRVQEWVYAPGPMARPLSTRGLKARLRYFLPLDRTHLTRFSIGAFAMPNPCTRPYAERAARCSTTCRPLDSRTFQEGH